MPPPLRIITETRIRWMLAIYCRLALYGGGGGGGLGGLGGGGFGGFAMRLPSNLRRRLLRRCGDGPRKWLRFQPGTNLSATPFMQ